MDEKMLNHIECKALKKDIVVDKTLLTKIIDAVSRYCNSNVEEVLKVENLIRLYCEVRKIVIVPLMVTEHELAAIVVGRMIINGWMHRVDEYAPIQHTRGILQLNPFLGCNCGCLYCFRNDAEGGLTDFYFGKKPTQIMSVNETIDRLEKHPWFVPNVTQIGINTSSTEAFLPTVKETTFALIDEIIRRGYKNDIVLISKWYLSEEDIKRLDFYENDILLFLTYTANYENVEPVTGTVEVKRKKFEQIKYLNRTSKLKWAHYYRPIAQGWNDSEEQILEALEFGANSTASVLGGLKMLTNMDQIAQNSCIPVPKGDFRSRAYKFLSPDLLEKIINIYEKKGYTQILVGDQSCGITVLKSAYNHAVANVEGLQMYDNYYDKSNDIQLNRSDNNFRKGCFGRCNPEQMELCCRGNANSKENEIRSLLYKLGINSKNIIISSDGIHVDERLQKISTDAKMAAINLLQVALHFDV